MIDVTAVQSPGELRAFIDVPHQLYSGIQGYEAPLRMDRTMLLDPAKSAFWQKARVQYWIAHKNGQPVGRISAQIDSILPVGLAGNAGMFGCLDSSDDPAVIKALIAQAEHWLRENGCTSMFGPSTLGMNDEPGLLVDGCNEQPMTLYPWHPPYLGPHLERLGFAKLQDLHSWRLDLVNAPPLSQLGRERLVERIPGLRLRYPDRKSYARDIQTLCDLYNDGWRNHWGFVPLTPADLAGLDDLMKWLVPREAFKMVEIDGQPVAVMLLIPNLFELTGGLGPDPRFIGWARLIWRALTHRYRSGRIIVFGISRKLQGTVKGAAVAALLVDELVKGQSILKGETVEAGWVLETNDALIQILERYKFERNRTFRIFGREIGHCQAAQ
jgi:hypothetical protein